MSIFEKVLIIDDDPTQLAILSAYFGSMRTRDILTAGDGIEAVQIMDTIGDSVDVVVCDLSMPNMDGLEFLRYLMEIAFVGGVVVISSLDATLLKNADHLGKMHGLNMKGTIRKPLTKSALDSVFSDPRFAKGPSAENTALNITSAQLSKGVKNNEFLSFYQPKMDLLTGKIVGAEALARWQMEDGRTISPSEFIPAAEKFRLIEPLTFALLSKVIEDIKTYGKHWQEFEISFNLPPAMLSQKELPDRLRSLITAQGLLCDMFCLEITESGVTEFDTNTIEVLSRLRIQGFKLSIDDFGTGASNISNLRMFPYSEMKIDRTFIHNIATDAFSAETVRASISLARQLDMRIVAEGVETKEVLDLLKARGVDQAQGFFISKPLTAAEINKFFTNSGAGGISLQHPRGNDKQVA